MNNLSEDYDSIVTTITQIIRVNDNKSINLTELFANLVDESKRITTRNKKSVLYTQHDKTKPKKLGKHRVEKSQKKCPYCKKGNHKEDKCWFKHPELRPKPKEERDNTVVTEVEEVAMPVFNTPSVEDFDVAEYEELAYSSSNACEFAYHSEINRIRFILDSGATVHICCEKAYFREIIPCNSTVS